MKFSEFKNKKNIEIAKLKEQNSKFSTQIETLVSELDKEEKRKFNTTPKSTKTWRNFTK